MLNRVENDLAKGEIAVLSVFLKRYTATDLSENICMWERVNRSYLILNVSPFHFSSKPDGAYNVTHFYIS